MARHYTDSELAQCLNGLKSAVTTWAKRHDLWYDCGFSSWTEQFDDELPDTPTPLTMYFSDTMAMVMNCYEMPELLEEFEALILEMGFWYGLETAHLVSFIPEDEDLLTAFRPYCEWEWILTLLKPDYMGLYDEIFARFSQRPEDLVRLTPRQYEEYIDAVFKNNGYQTQLGPGHGDEGVDLRIYTNDIASEVLTLVQLKRYASNRPIRLEAVQALSAAVEDERANRGLFITTSRYLPGAMRFAARQNRRIQLATSEDVQRWSATAAANLKRDWSTTVSEAHVLSVMSQNASGGLLGRIFVANCGFNTVDQAFAIVVKETPGAVIMVRLRDTIVSGNEWRGNHIPNLSPVGLPKLNNRTVFRAKKCQSYSSGVAFSGQRLLYTLWDGKPMWFDR